LDSVKPTKGGKNMGEIQGILEEEDKIQALNLIQARWPEKNRDYLDFFLREHGNYCLELKDEKNTVNAVLLARKTSKKDKVWLEIQIILVEGSLRRRGIGSHLMDEIEKICWKEGIKDLFLSSGEDDLANGSFSFYLKRGFKIVGSVRNPGESLLFFQKEVIPS
jgi:GNAT superfamily N-acetyltransferase